MKTFSAKKNTIKKKWYCIDAQNKILGRLATTISIYLRGKHKPEYTKHIDTGDYVIVVNAKKILLTGKKNINKKYYHHTGYIGGIKQISFKDMLITNPERIIYLAVKGMLPKNSLGREMLKKLKIFSDHQHIHFAQNPHDLYIT
ncbi:50S ribosomal protein L13 [Buchnera aphidicola (Thelaxes californica)]|uniref:Large ribosomal subunit protein uL13 n=1 Tax=Buchnera aphidicola (Thelaxes californica) TaxID=1315998 RepID=A0A4D6YBT0_9GAMM|nr:50S ribosomal protein L13 [Buchnera aphidicola]QCI26829.1 50S ribosomal protein L13 [Buchnera aphidicola (Thelaxes californica)]